jgi:hypothetical protein
VHSFAHAHTRSVAPNDAGLEHLQTIALRFKEIEAELPAI